jgi:hypothetical protein
VLRKLREILAMGLPILGTVLVFVAILVPAISLNLQLQILVVLVGILFIEAGVWRLTEKVLPSERKYLALRAQVDDFIGGVRVLNARAVAVRSEETAGTRAAYEAALAALHSAVDRMGEVAGLEEDRS